MKALLQRLLDVGTTRLGGLEARAQVGARAERAAVAGEHDGADRVVLAAAFERASSSSPSSASTAFIACGRSSRIVATAPRRCDLHAHELGIVLCV